MLIDNAFRSYCKALCFGQRIRRYCFGFRRVKSGAALRGSRATSSCRDASQYDEGRTFYGNQKKFVLASVVGRQEVQSAGRRKGTRRDARDEARKAEERAQRQESHESEAGHCHRAVGSAARRREGAEKVAQQQIALASQHQPERVLAFALQRIIAFASQHVAERVVEVAEQRVQIAVAVALERQPAEEQLAQPLSCLKEGMVPG